MACDADEIRALLADAKDAYHKLMIGKSARVFVDQNGERIEYTAANAYRLSAYIRSLQQQLAACTGGTQTGRPMRIYL